MGHNVLSSLPEATAQTESDWHKTARDKQRTPAGVWRIWLILAGRGWGKTRTGAEHILEMVRTGKAARIALVAPTAADARDVMVEGQSGILSIAADHERPNYEPSKRRLTFPNGAVATTFSADEPTRLRGPQFDYAWCDELAAWRYPETWDMLMFGLRLGDDPRCIVTTTPKPTKIIKELVQSDMVHVTTGTTYENEDNLAPAFFAQIVRKYEGTRLGRQELLAQILTDVPGALWSHDMIERDRVKEHPPLKRVVVAIDPAASNNEDSDETGMIVAGVGSDDQGYVLADVTIKGSPAQWGKRAIDAYHEYRADRIVIERNNGGDMVKNTITTIRDDNDKPIGQSIPLTTVWASRGKLTRAEPISALYEQGRVHHVGMFPELEDQMCTWVPGETSPDRMDALVWAFTELMIGPSREVRQHDYNPFYN